MPAPRQTAPVVVTGAGGELGRRVVLALSRRATAVRGLGRGSAPQGFPAPWARVDLLSGAGLSTAFTGAGTIVHCASDPFARGADVRAARHLARAAGEAGVARLIFVQIAGISEAARGFYYREKLDAEQILREGPVPYSSAAATQFHGLLDRVFRLLAMGPIMPLPKFELQPVDIDFFAQHLADQALATRPPDTIVCGPQALTSRTGPGLAWCAQGDEADRTYARYGSARRVRPYPARGWDRWRPHMARMADTRREC